MKSHFLKYSPLLCLLIYSFLFPYFSRASDKAQAACHKKLKVGVSLSLSGGMAASGEAVKKSILLAKNKYDTAECVEFVFEDDQFQAKNTVTAVQKLINIDHVNGVIVWGTPTAMAVGDLVESKQIPMIAISILKKVVEGRRYIMKHWVTAEKLNEAIVAEVRKQGYKKIAIVTMQNDAMLGLRDLFVKENIAEISLNDEVLPSDFDFRTIGTRIVRVKVDAVYNLLLPPQTGIFVKQLRGAGYVGPVFGAHNVEDPKEVEASAGTMIGMWFVNGDFNRGENYVAEYKSNFGDNIALGGANGFDVAKMYIEAAYQDLDLNTFFHNLTNFSGAFGIYNATLNNDYDFKAYKKLITPNGFPMEN